MRLPGMAATVATAALCVGCASGQPADGGVDAIKARAFHMAYRDCLYTGMADKHEELLAGIYRGYHIIHACQQIARERVR